MVYTNRCREFVRRRELADWRSRWSVSPIREDKSCSSLDDRTSPSGSTDADCRDRTTSADSWRLHTASPCTRCLTQHHHHHHHHHHSQQQQPFWQWCGLRPSVLGQQRFQTKKIGLGLGLARCGLDLSLGLAGLLLCCETRSFYTRRHNDLEGHSNFSSTTYRFSLLCLEHHYCGDQQWRLLTEKLNPTSAFLYFRWSWSRS